MAFNYLRKSLLLLSLINLQYILGYTEISKIRVSRGNVEIYRSSKLLHSSSILYYNAGEIDKAFSKMYFSEEINQAPDFDNDSAFIAVNSLQHSLPKYFKFIALCDGNPSIRFYRMKSCDELIVSVQEFKKKEKTELSIGLIIIIKLALAILSVFAIARSVIFNRLYYARIDYYLIISTFVFGFYSVFAINLALLYYTHSRFTAVLYIICRTVTKIMISCKLISVSKVIYYHLIA